MSQTIPSVNYVDSDALFADLDQRRESGELAKAISEDSGIAFQLFVTRPGMLEARHADGRVKLGRFTYGRFIPEENPSDILLICASDLILYIHTVLWQSPA